MRPPFENPAELLRTAARVLQTMQPAFSTHVWAHGIQYRVRWDYPGRVSVFDRNTGELIVRSKPGRPTVPDGPGTPARAAGRDPRWPVGFDGL